MKTPQLPVPNLNKELGISNEVWFKYENKHHYGSHKGRSIPFMIDEYGKTGITSFVISSSGNASLAALRAVASHNKNKSRAPLQLKIFVGQNISENKLKNLQNETANPFKSDAANIPPKRGEAPSGLFALPPSSSLRSATAGTARGDFAITIEQVENPKQSAKKFETETGAKWLRSSSDPLALFGYEGLAEELAKIEGLSAVFIPTSSGTTAEGLAKGFKLLGKNPQLHIVQTTNCHPIVSYLFSMQNKNLPELQEEKSLAGAIVDLVGLRKQSVSEAVTQSNGAGWIATNDDIKVALELGKKFSVTLSPNSALALVGLKKAIEAGMKWGGPVVCLVTGD